MSREMPEILIVDDEAHIRVFLKSALKRMPCRIVGEAVNGREAVEKYRELRPDLVLLDQNMPHMNGEEALAQIIAADPEAQVVLLTSVSDADSVQKCISLGARDYIRKDLELDEIRRLIAEILGDLGRDPEGEADGEV